jgi:hypothetical protein
MNRRELFGAGILLAISPWFIPPEKYRIKIKTHIIKDFKSTRFISSQNTKHLIPGFRVNKHMALSSKDPTPSDPGLTVDNALLHTAIIDNIRALAEASYNFQNREIIVCNVVLEAPDGYHVTQVGMGSIYNNLSIHPNEQMV